jgi:hypothetical protein
VHVDRRWSDERVIADRNFVTALVGRARIERDRDAHDRAIRADRFLRDPQDR